MKERPSTKELLMDSHRFILSNGRFAKLSIVKILLPVMLLTIIISAGSGYSLWFSLVYFIGVYFYSCFMLTWFRAFLLSPSDDHVVDPFSLKSSDRKFITAVYSVIILFCVGGLAYSPLVAIGKRMDGDIMSWAFYALAAFVIGWCWLLSLRWSFVLPARALGVERSLKEARKFSNGLAWPLFFTGFLFSVGVNLVFYIYIFLVVKLINLFFSADLTAYVVYVLFLTVPLVFMQFYVTAMFVGIMSRLYQWAVQERG